MMSKGVQIPRLLVNLGKAKSLLLTDSSKIRWKSAKFRLFATPSGKRLFVIKSEVISNVDLDLDDKAVRGGVYLYANFKDFEPGRGSYIPSNGLENAKKIGRCGSIIYNSDKWTGRATSYIHEFKVPPIIWYDKKTESCALTGGNINVTAEGITG